MTRHQRNGRAYVLLQPINAGWAFFLGVILSLSACSEKIEAAPPASAQPIGGERAFPGAIGHGAAATGGRGGRIIQVTKRDDHGEGSLRSCLLASGPRVCVFRVGGIFRFSGRPPIITNPDLTIAGQTAPGGGVVITHAGGDAARTPLLIKNTANIIVRHVRIRLDRLSENRRSDDAITVENSEDVLIDHVSASWASDELFNGYGDNDRITVSNSIFSFGIPSHDKCALLASDPVDAQSLSFIGNICAHNGDRNPDINFPPGSCVEVSNNVLYNAQSQFAEVWEQFGGSPVSIIGNYFIAGPDTRRGAQGIARNVIGSTGDASIYLWDNAFSGEFDHIADEVEHVQVEQTPCAPTIEPISANQAYADVLSGAGAWPRDMLDEQVVEDIERRGGRIVSRPGAIPTMAPGRPYADADEDGMDDAWEQSHGSNPASADSWEDADGDGISNFENFLTYRENALRPGAGG